MRHHRGFTLVDMLLAISLLGVFSLLAFRLIGADMSITEATLKADSNTARFDRAVRMLRSDVSTSASVEMTEPGLLRIHGSSGQPIEWKITGSSLTRSAGSEHRDWDVGQPLKMKLDGAVVVLSVSPFDQIAMASLPKGAAR